MITMVKKLRKIYIFLPSFCRIFVSVFILKLNDNYLAFFTFERGYWCGVYFDAKKVLLLSLKYKKKSVIASFLFVFKS